MNLMQEYRRRHNQDFVWSSQAGCCFFNDRNDEPALICLTNLQGQAFSTCTQCAQSYPGMIIELFSLAEAFPHYNLSSHTHVGPDLDLMKIMRQRDLFPVVAKPRDLEMWLWKVFIKYNKIDLGTSWEKLCNGELDRMFVCASKFSATYQRFYGMCQMFLAGKKYLLLGE